MPLPLAPALIVIHPALLADAQAQPVAAVTVMVPLPDAAPTLAAAEPIAGSHGAPACVTLKVWLPIVSVPVRGLVVGLAVTVYVTVPLPLPLVPALIVIHPALLAAVHAQPLTAVTVTLAVPAAAPILFDAGAIVWLHGTPACVTVNVLPPIESVPVRGLVVAFAVTS